MCYAYNWKVSKIRSAKKKSQLAHYTCLIFELFCALDRCYCPMIQCSNQLKELLMAEKKLKQLWSRIIFNLLLFWLMNLGIFFYQWVDYRWVCHMHTQGHTCMHEGIHISMSHWSICGGNTPRNIYNVFVRYNECYHSENSPGWLQLAF